LNLRKQVETASGRRSIGFVFTKSNSSTITVQPVGSQASKLARCASALGVGDALAVVERRYGRTPGPPVPSIPRENGADPQPLYHLGFSVAANTCSSLG